MIQEICTFQAFCRFERITFAPSMVEITRQLQCLLQ